jgi:hypothetical protein
VQWKEEKQQLKKKKEEAKADEEDFCYYRASALFNYSSSRYSLVTLLVGTLLELKLKCMCVFFFLG